LIAAEVAGAISIARESSRILPFHRCFDICTFLFEWFGTTVFAGRVV
jgi:hypothetical protein